MKLEALCKYKNTYSGNLSMQTNLSCINPLQYFEVNKQKRLQKQNSVCTDSLFKKKKKEFSSTSSTFIIIIFLCYPSNREEILNIHNKICGNQLKSLSLHNATLTYISSSFLSSSEPSLNHICPFSFPEH